jgi:spermidine/putrescine transport system permease protein
MTKRSPLSPLSIYFWSLAILLYVPISLMVVFSFNNSTELVFPLRGFTIQWYLKLIGEEELLGTVRTSLVLGLGSGLVSTILGTLGAIALARFSFRGSGIFLAVAATPLVIPYVILGVSLLILFNEAGIRLSAWAAGVGHVVIGLPYALLIVTSRLVGFPENLEEAAMDLGTTYWGALLRVTIPISLPALIAAFLVSFTISFDEFAISSFLVGTDPTLPVYIYSQLRFPTRLPLVVALSAILMIASMLILMIADWLLRLGESQ